MKNPTVSVFAGLITLAILAGMLVGCEDRIFVGPPATIAVERAEAATGGVRVIVYYRNHQTSQQEHCFLTLDNVDQIREYRRQAEFLLNQLDEAERRMQVHEQVPVEPAPVPQSAEQPPA